MSWLVLAFGFWLGFGFFASPSRFCPRCLVFGFWLGLACFRLALAPSLVLAAFALGVLSLAFGFWLGLASFRLPLAPSLLLAAVALGVLSLAFGFWLGRMVPSMLAWDHCALGVLSLAWLLDWLVPG